MMGASEHSAGVAPNHDTLYALVILDLRAGPQALTVPKIYRHCTFQAIDAWMDTITNIGTRGTKGEPGTWVVHPARLDGPSASRRPRGEGHH